MKLMIPNKQKWKKWTIPSKASVAGYWLSVLGILLAILYYFFPFAGVLTFFERTQVEIPGESFIEQKINLAKIEGVKYKNPNSAYVIVKTVTFPVLNRLTNLLTTELWGNQFLLVSVSPFKPSDQKTIFEPGQCRLSGKATHVNTTKMEGTFDIETISCVDSRVEAYKLTSEMLHSRRIGYLTRTNDIGNNNLPLIKKDKVLTLNDEKNIIVIFDTPVSQLQRVSKSSVRF
jgi:hypothetical protein